MSEKIEKLLSQIINCVLSGNPDKVYEAKKQILDEFEKLEMEESQAQMVWTSLAILVGCTSPDGSAELGQVEFYQTKYTELEMEIERLKGIIDNLHNDGGL